MSAVRRCVLVAMLLSSIGALAQPAAAFDFTQYQSTVRHDGRVQESGLDPPFTRAWSRRMDAPGYPVIANGHVFVIDRNGAGFGTLLRAIDLSTGSQMWRRLIGGDDDWAALTYDSGRLFVINNAGILQALDPLTGTKIWAIALSPQYFFTAPPTASDGVVYVNGSGSGGTLYAVSEADGSVMWTAADDNGDASAPTLSAKRVFVQFACTLTQAFRRTDGKELWRYETGCSGGGGATAVLHDGLLYARDFSDNRILTARDGTFVDTYAASAIPTFDGGSMYSLVKNRLRATDLTTGEIRWSHAYDGGFVSNPLIVNRWVFEASSLGQIAAFRRGSGRLEWHAPIPPVDRSVDFQLKAPLTGLAAGNGYLIVPTKHHLVAFRGASAQSLAMRGR